MDAASSYSPEAQVDSPSFPSPISLRPLNVLKSFAQMSFWAHGLLGRLTEANLGGGKEGGQVVQEAGGAGRNGLTPCHTLD